jgi:hypothetical protein
VDAVQLVVGHSDRGRTREEVALELSVMWTWSLTKMMEVLAPSEKRESIGIGLARDGGDISQPVPNPT